MAGFEINSVALSGNLVRDPELRSTGSGTSVCGLRIASNSRYKDASGEWRDRAGFYDVTIWKGLGEWVANNLARGDKIVVQGRLDFREWEDGSGNKRSAVQVVADSIVPAPKDGGGGGGGRATRGDLDADSGPKATDDFAPASSGRSSDDDIPF